MFDDLDAAMAGDEPEWDSEPTPAVDLVEVDRWLTRLARLDRVDEQTRMLAGLRRSTVDEWEAEQLARTAVQRDWLVASLRGFHQAVLADDEKRKTITLPSGVLKARAQQPVWSFDDDRFLAWAREHRPELVRVPVASPAPDRAEARKVLQVVDGRVIDPTTGQVVDGVTVTPKPDKFTAEARA